MILGSILLAATAAKTPLASGRVVGENGEPVAGAEACIFDTEGKQVACVTTDKEGFYRMENPAMPHLLIQAPGYKAQGVLAAPQNEPVVLRRAVTLTVRVLDAATGEPIPKGTVSFHLPTGRNVGSPVPFNRSGVKLSNMSTGETLIQAKADGYVSGDPVVVDLKGQAPQDVVIRLKKTASR